ncbi:hypothetical protein C0J52_13182 [Blattella germanica]|nr:hypothetical protein C0J52_13182 [Blattella germanica]
MASDEVEDESFGGGDDDLGDEGGTSMSRPDGTTEENSPESEEGQPGGFGHTASSVGVDQEDDDDYEPEDGRNKRKKGKKRKARSEDKKGKKKKKKKKADSGDESDYAFDDEGGGNDSDFVGGSSSRKSRKSRGSQKHTPQPAAPTPVQDSNSEAVHQPPTLLVPITA